MDIEAVIAEAQSATGAATEVASTEAPQTPEVKAEQAPTEVKPKPDAELTPEQLAKREANRQSKLNSTQAKMRRELKEMREWRDSIMPILAKQTAPQNTAPQPPDENQFTDWDELRAAERKYYADLARHEAKQEISERETKSIQQTDAQAQQQRIAAKVHEIGLKTQEFGKANPEYFDLVSQHEDFLNNMPAHIEQAFLSAESQQLALLALMKEGNLEALEDMTPAQVIREIAKAEIRGEQYLNQNKTTNAPAPVTSARGTGNPGKALHEQSVEELLKRFN
jgi:ribosomal protein L12E/L44/L45/RPP1/RPP2